MPETLGVESGGGTVRDPAGGTRTDTGGLRGTSPNDGEEDNGGKSYGERQNSRDSVGGSRVCREMLGRYPTLGRVLLSGRSRCDLPKDGPGKRRPVGGLPGVGPKDHTLDPGTEETLFGIPFGRVGYQGTSL